MATVLHITECYDGGTGRAIAARVVNAPDHQHHLLWAGDEVPDPRVKWASTTPLPSGFRRRVRAISAAERALRPDYIHAHSSWAGAYARIVRRTAPIIYEAHCFRFDDPTLSGGSRMLFRLAEQIMARRTATFGVLTPREAQLVAGLSERASAVLIPNVPTLPIVRSVMREPRVTSPVVSMLGRIAPQKDPGFFLEVARRVRSAVPHVKFRWIGDGSARDRERLLLAGVEVTGWLDAQGVAQSLLDTDVYFHSAAYEGFPLSVLDAAACGIPIAARSIPAFAHAPILSSGTVDGVAILIEGLLSDRLLLAAAGDANETLLSIMNEHALRRVLRQLYDNDEQA